MPGRRSSAFGAGAGSAMPRGAPASRPVKAIDSSGRFAGDACGPRSIPCCPTQRLRRLSEPKQVADLRGVEQPMGDEALCADQEPVSNGRELGGALGRFNWRAQPFAEAACPARDLRTPRTLASPPLLRESMRSDVRRAPAGCERWPSGHLGEVGGEALRVLRVKPRVFERCPATGSETQSSCHRRHTARIASKRPSSSYNPTLPFCRATVVAAISKRRHRRPPRRQDA